jgi:hypothetical protein
MRIQAKLRLRLRTQINPSFVSPLAYRHDAQFVLFYPPIPLKLEPRKTNSPALHLGAGAKGKQLPPSVYRKKLYSCSRALACK